MIKPIQLLKESFATYKANIKNIIWMTWPVVLLTIIGQYYSLKMEEMKGVVPVDITMSLIIILISFISFIAIILFFKPALMRSLQKNESNKSFDVKEGFDFAKKNIWNYIVLGFWSGVYFIRFSYIYIAIIIFSTLVAVFGYKYFLNFIGSQVSIMHVMSTMIYIYILYAVLIINVLIMVLKNITKFILINNIFFSKDIKARDAVKEGIALGQEKNKDIWKIILTSIVFMLITIVIYFLIGVLTGVIRTLAPEYIVTWVEMIVSALIASIVISPISFAIFAKGYAKIAGEVMVVEEVKEEIVRV